MKLRKVEKNELIEIVEMYHDDFLGKNREIINLPLDIRYLNAFDKIDNDPNQELLVLVDSDDFILGTIQITYIQFLNRLGSKRALFEAIRIHKDYRGKGLGKILCQLAIELAKKKDVQMIQLTSDKERTDALRFYESLGFKATHQGFKMEIK